jgi:hypothetical protein
MAVLGGHQGGVGAGQRLGANVVLPHPAQPRPAERRRVEADQRLEPCVAGFGQQHGADAGRDVPGPRPAFAGVGEPGGKAGSGVDLQLQLGQVHPRHPRLDGHPESNEAGRLVQLVEGGQDQLVAVHLHAGVFAQVGGRGAIGRVQPLTQSADLRAGIRREAECATDRRPRRLPCRAGKQPKARVGVP